MVTFYKYLNAVIQKNISLGQLNSSFFTTEGSGLDSGNTFKLLMLRPLGEDWRSSLLVALCLGLLRAFPNCSLWSVLGLSPALWLSFILIFYLVAFYTCPILLRLTITISVQICVLMSQVRVNGAVKVCLETSNDSSTHLSLTILP